MALINRLTRLFRADFHAVLDRIEEPAVLLRQAIREMEDALACDEQRNKLLQQEHGQIIAREGEIEHALDEIEEELDVCFESGKSDLARALIKRKLEAQRFGKVLVRKRKALEQTLTDLDSRLQENRTHLEGMRQKAELLSEAEAMPRSDEYAMPPEMAIGKEEIEVAFLREQQRRCQS